MHRVKTGRFCRVCDLSVLKICQRFHDSAERTENVIKLKAQRSVSDRRAVIYLAAVSDNIEVMYSHWWSRSAALPASTVPATTSAAAAAVKSSAVNVKSLWKFGVITVFSETNCLLSHDLCWAQNHNKLSSLLRYVGAVYHSRSLERVHIDIVMYFYFQILFNRN